MLNIVINKKLCIDEKRLNTSIKRNVTTNEK